VNHLDPVHGPLADSAARCAFDNHDDRFVQPARYRGGADPADELPRCTGPVPPPTVGPRTYDVGGIDQQRQTITLQCPGTMRAALVPGYTGRRDVFFGRLGADGPDALS
jgi:hypothetical protein